MAILTGGVVIEGTYGPYFVAGAPSAGTDEVQTLTIGGTPTGGTFKLAFRGFTTAAITWSAVNATLIAAIDAALGALPSVNGAANVTVAVGTMTAGIGTATITFVAELGKAAVELVTVANNSLTGTLPTLAIAETTPGVTATARGILPGGIVIDTTNGKTYQNSGTSSAPVFGLVGAQT